MSASAGAARINATFRLVTPPTAGAVAIIDLDGDAPAALHALGIDPPAPGRPSLRSLAGVDDGLVILWSDDHAQIMPHGGPVVVGALLERLAGAGVFRADELRPDDAFPEAADRVEARALSTLASAASPAAVDLLLDQSRRWRAWDGVDPPAGRIDELSRALDRLVSPPLVVAVGRPNVGKSTLTNALARRAVSLVADVPGTTRDHVGVSLELPSPLGGVVVRWLDAPGVPAGGSSDEVEAAACRLAAEAARAADLVILCGDGVVGWPAPEDLTLSPDGAMLRAGLRADLAPPGPCDLSLSVARDDGVGALAQAVRRRLVPDEALAWDGPWRFDPALPL